jgi:hypothetical protein
MLEPYAERLDFVIALQHRLLQILVLLLSRLRALDGGVDLGAQLDEFLYPTSIVSLHNQQNEAGSRGTGRRGYAPLGRGLS